MNAGTNMTQSARQKRVYFACAALCAGLATTQLLACVDTTVPHEEENVQGAAGAVAVSVSPLDIGSDPGHQLHQRCIMDPGRQGSCAEGLVCSQFNTPEPYCWNTVPNCRGSEVPAFDLCATPCARGTLPRAAGGCPPGLVCDDGGVWCVPRAF